MTSGSFDERIRALARRVRADSGDLDSGHVRWGIYSQAMGDPDEWPELLGLVREEPDQTISSAVVVELLEALPDHLRADFVSALPSGEYREYAANRARDIATLEKISAEGRASGEEGHDVRSWSARLQLRAANEASDVSLLEDLSSTGKTRRIRESAERRLRSLRGSA